MPISCESSWILDCMTSLCEVTVDVTEFVYHNQVDIDGLVDENADIRSSIVDMYKEWRPDADIHNKAYISFRGMLGSEWQFEEVTSYLTEKVVNAYRESHGKKSPMNGCPETDLYIDKEEDMCKESNIIYLMERNKEQRWLRMLEDMFHDFVDVRTEVNMKEFLEWEHQRIEDMRKRMQQARVYIDDPRTLDPAMVKRLDKECKIRLKQGQKVLKKGIKTFTNLFGPDNINAFISGHDFTIEGERYNYRVEKKQDLVSYSANPTAGHIPYKLQLLTKDNIVMADGCVYFEDTPVIDQLIAMMLHIKYGNEEEILKKTNFFSTQDAYYSDAYIKELKGIKHKKPNQDEIRNLFDFMGEERSDIDKYRPMIKPVIQQVLVNMVDIPESTFRAMMKPNMVYDDFQFLEYDAAEQLLLESLSQS